AACARHSDPVLHRLPDWAHEIVGCEPVLAVPADLAADEDELALGRNTVGIAFGLGPAGGLQDCVRCHDGPWFLSWKRWILPVCVFGRAVVNFTERGYL